MENIAVKAVNLNRTYKKGHQVTEALKGLSLEIQKGELFGVLGRNGAGKTTFLKILSTLLYPTSGQAWVDGWDVVKESHKVREIINLVTGGENSGYGILNLRENLWMFSQFYGLPSREAFKRIDYYLERFNLADKAKTRVSALSSGMKQKMGLIRGLLNDPKVLFLDEPTIGLDVESAREIRSFLKEWMKDSDRTTILTTHYMFEAEELSHRLAIIEGGQIVALGTPDELKSLAGKEPFYELTLKGLPLTYSFNLEGINLVTRRDENGMSILTIKLEEDSLLSVLLQNINSIGGNLVFLKKKEPTLEDAFVSLVGRGIDEAGK